jgi:hypothetical protein
MTRNGIIGAVVLFACLLFADRFVSAQFPKPDAYFVSVRVLGADGKPCNINYVKPFGKDKNGLFEFTTCPQEVTRIGK